MAAFRRVDAHLAGPGALGILVPPGVRTVVILRPRALPWDLLPLRPGMEQAAPAVFCDLDRDEAAGLARRAQLALEAAVQGGTNPLEVVATGPEERFGVCARVAEHLWILCARDASRPYAPLWFGDLAGAERALAQLTPHLWPAADGGQEYYFNTQRFARRD